jgi:site-specific recombinase XerD
MIGTKMIYKAVTHNEWLESYSKTNPNAVMNEQKTEVMLTLNDGSGNLTREQAQDYISTNWSFTDE